MTLGWTPQSSRDEQQVERCVHLPRRAYLLMSSLDGSKARVPRSETGAKEKSGLELIPR